jgi:hypothetical protein
MTKYPDVDILQGCTSSNSEVHKKIFSKFPVTSSYITDKSIISKMFLLTQSPFVPAWNKMVRKDFIIEKDLFFKEGVIHEDVLWDFFLSKHVKSLAIVGTTTYVY